MHYNGFIKERQNNNILYYTALAHVRIMTNIKILKYPHPALRKKARPVMKIDKSIIRLAQQMLDAMYKEGGVGLAATQIGKSIRMVVINLTKKPSDAFILINPKIEKKTGKIQETEGCLSLPGMTAEVTRCKGIICRALNLEDKEIIIDTENIDPKVAEVLSRVIQHELDHLDGVLFIDYLSDSEKKNIAQQLQTLKTQFKH